jgi:hypothetical protein
MSGCDAGIFADGGRNSACLLEHPNATLPTQWTPQGFRQFGGLNMTNFSCFGYLIYQLLVGEGMFSKLTQLHCDWTEVVGAIIYSGNLS